MENQQLNIDAKSVCPCCSGADFASCCRPFLDESEMPETAEQLMRSRYSAYVGHNWRYIIETWHPDFRGGITVDKLIRSAENTSWLSLEVISARGGTADFEGEVSFVARFDDQGRVSVASERSSFLKVDGRWLYTSGETGIINKKMTEGKSEHASKKTGRNDSCPCGSGFKFKKCCGRERQKIR